MGSWPIPGTNDFLVGDFINHELTDKPLIAQVKENGKLAGKMLVMVESTLEVHKTDSSLNSFTLNYFFNIFSHNRISPLSYIKNI